MFANQKVLAETLGVDESTVTMTLSVARLPEEVMSEMVQSPDQFGPRMAYEIGRFHSAKGRDKTLRLIHRIVEEGIGVRQVKGLITAPDSETADTPARPARARYQQRIDITLADGTTAGHLKTYGNDRLDLQLVGLPQATRDKIQRQIEEILRPLQKDAAGGPKADADEQS
jgi:ParB family chromosome partitioning protein